MKKLVVYLACLALCAVWLGFEFSLNDVADFILLGIAAVLLSGVLFFLLLAAFGLYRTFRYWKGDEVREDGLLDHDGLQSQLIPWDRIEALSIKAIETGPRFRRFGVTYSKSKAPALHIHLVDRKKPLHIHFSDMPGKIAEMQAQLRAKSPRYRQHEIDWVERWNARDPLVQLKKMAAERKRRAAEPAIAPEIQEQLDVLRAAGKSDEEVFAEYLRLSNLKK